MKEVWTAVLLFLLGAVIGWLLEVVFRNRSFRKVKEYTFVNPGCCVGPYLPIYGCVQCLFYFCAQAGYRIRSVIPIGGSIAVLLLMTAGILILEYVSGFLALKITGKRFWDYSGQKWNIGGFVSLKFSFYWLLLAANYYFILHPYFTEVVTWQRNTPQTNGWLAAGFIIVMMDLIKAALHSKI